MIQSKNETEDLLLWVTKKGETLIRQIEKQKKQSNLNSHDQENHFISNHLYRMKVGGWLV